VVNYQLIICFFNTNWYFWGNLTVFCLFHFNIISCFWKWQMDFLGAALGISTCIPTLNPTNECMLQHIVDIWIVNVFVFFYWVIFIILFSTLIRIYYNGQFTRTYLYTPKVTDDSWYRLNNFFLHCCKRL